MADCGRIMIRKKNKQRRFKKRNNNAKPRIIQGPEEAAGARNVVALRCFYVS